MLVCIDRERVAFDDGYLRGRVSQRLHGFYADYRQLAEVLPPYAASENVLEDWFSICFPVACLQSVELSTWPTVAIEWASAGTRHRWTSGLPWSPRTTWVPMESDRAKEQVGEQLARHALRVGWPLQPGGWHTQQRVSWHLVGAHSQVASAYRGVSLDCSHERGLTRWDRTCARVRGQSLQTAPRAILLQANYLYGWFDGEASSTRLRPWTIARVPRMAVRRILAPDAGARVCLLGRSETLVLPAHSAVARVLEAALRTDALHHRRDDVSRACRASGDPRMPGC